MRLSGNIHLWATDNRWEDGSGCVISGETGLAHTGTVIYYKGSDLFTHLGFIIQKYEFQLGGICRIIEEASNEPVKTSMSTK